MVHVVEETKRILRLIGNLNVAVKMNLDGFDLLLERSNDELRRQEFLYDLNVVRGEIRDEFFELRSILAEARINGQKCELLEVSKILNDFWETIDAVPLVQNRIESLRNEILDQTNSKMSYGDNQNKVPKTRRSDFTRSPRKPSPGPLGSIRGSSIPEGHWMLTFDDGPTPPVTLPILKELARYKVTATFFGYVNIVRYQSDIVKQILREGHDFGAHSWSHPKNLHKLEESRLLKEVFEATSELEGLADSKIKLFRCPYGHGGNNYSRARQKIASRGLINVNWNVDSGDTADRCAESILWRVEKQMEKVRGGIILFHDLHSATAEATRRFLSKHGSTQSFGKFDTFYKASEDDLFF